MGKLVINILLAICVLYFVVGGAALFMKIATWTEFTQFVAIPTSALYVYLQVRPDKPVGDTTTTTKTTTVPSSLGITSSNIDNVSVDNMSVDNLSAPEKEK